MIDEFTIPDDLDLATTLVGFRIFPDCIQQNDNGWFVKIMSPKREFFSGDGQTPRQAFIKAVSAAGGKVKGE